MRGEPDSFSRGGHEDAGRSRPERRRELLLGAGAGALAIVAASGCGADEEGSGADPGSSDPSVRRLGELLQLERRADSVFRQGRRFSDGRTRRLLETLGEQALAHIQLLESLIRDAGADVPAGGREPGSAFIRDADSAVRAAGQLSERQLDAYAAAMPELAVGVRREVGTIYANNAQHLILLEGARAASAAPGLADG